MKVLAIRNSALGDVAMTLPVLYCVAAQHPDTDFYLLTRPFFARMFINRPANLHIIEADFKGEYRGALGLLKLIKKLRGYRFDAVADLHNILRSWVIDAAMLIRGKRVAMVDKMRAKRLGSDIKQQRPNFVDRYADVFARLGFPVTLDFHSVFGDKLPAPPVPVVHPAVGIAPFARYANKTYPPELMQQEVKLLTDQGVNVYLFGSRGKEAEMLNSWAESYPNCTCMAAKTDLAGELAMMANLDAMLTMDSANQHLASITGTKVISLWGSTTPACGFLGYGQNADDAIVAGLDCQPCTVAGSDSCPKGHMQCLRAITPERIVNKILSFLR